MEQNQTPRTHGYIETIPRCNKVTYNQGGELSLMKLFGKLLGRSLNFLGTTLITISCTPGGAQAVVLADFVTTHNFPDHRSLEALRHKRAETWFATVGSVKSKFDEEFRHKVACYSSYFPLGNGNVICYHIAVSEQIVWKNSIITVIDSKDVLIAYAFDGKPKKLFEVVLKRGGAEKATKSELSALFRNIDAWPASKKDERRIKWPYDKRLAMYDINEEFMPGERFRMTFGFIREGTSAPAFESYDFVSTPVDKGFPICKVEKVELIKAGWH